MECDEERSLLARMSLGAPKDLALIGALLHSPAPLRHKAVCRIISEWSVKLGVAILLPSKGEAFPCVQYGR